jgi:hypothetical protein
MTKAGSGSVIALIFIFVLTTCIEPFIPNIEVYQSLLVVDGLITDENSAYSVKLSKSMQEDAEPVMVSDASVSVSDDIGNTYYFENAGEGNYKSIYTQFTGSVGRTYTLNISTSDGEVFRSDPCLMYDVPEIDTIFFEKDEVLANNGTESDLGIQIYIKSKEGDDSRYYRWAYDETWKFKVPNPSRSLYIDESHIIMNPDVREYCWKSRKSDGILINRTYPGDSKTIQKIPLTFIASDKSDRLLLHYSILVRQFSISKEEYEFWFNLSKIDVIGGDIFAAQPYSVSGNIHDVNNPDKKVLGYFQVSAVRQKRKEIPFSEVVGLNLPYYQYPCIRVEDSPNILPWAKFNPPLTWDDIHYMYTTSGYTFVEPKYIHGTLILDRLVFTKIVCSDCSVSGSTEKPDFWKDIFK